MRCNGNRANSRTATSMRDAEGFVEVQMTDISSIVTRSADSYLSIHIGTVEIHLPSVLVDQIADGSNTFFENTMGRWVGNHERSECVSVLLHLGF